MTEHASRYHSVGHLPPEYHERRDEAGVLVAAWSTTQELWVCEDCGSVVTLRGNHDQWHTLNDSPLMGVIGRHLVDES